MKKDSTNPIRHTIVTDPKAFSHEQGQGYKKKAIFCL